MTNLEIVKPYIQGLYHLADCGLFFQKNLCGDPVTPIYCHNGLEIWISYPYSYFEVFGLNYKEEQELLAFYNKLRGGGNK